MRGILTVLFSLLIFCVSSYSKAAKPIVVLLSIDGFAYNYLEKYQPKNILAFASSGVSAKLLPVYPSKTFPNHLSIITGAYPVKHGILHNSFYNPEIGEKYSLGAGKNDKRWLTAEPFWSIAEQAKIKSAVYFWPESESLTVSTSPSYNVPYNHGTSNKTRVDQIITWLQMPESKSPQFISSYFSTVDTAGHEYGPNSPGVALAIAEIDALFGYFIERLNNEVKQSVNIILVSDHGMVAVEKQKAITTKSVLSKTAENLININAITVAKSSTQLLFYFDKSLLSRVQQEKLVNELEIQQQQQQLFTLHHKGKFPKRWYLDKNEDIVPDLILEAKPGATFIKEANSHHFNRGAHGYDPFERHDLTAIFIASGPNFDKSRAIAPFKNIHITPMLNELFSLPTIKKIDGSASVLKTILK